MTGLRETTAPPYGRPLDHLNFFLADVKGGLGPYLGIYLLTQQHWNQAAIGIVATVAGIVGLIVDAPVGAFIDATRWKRGAIVAGVGVLTASALAIAAAPIFPIVLTAQTMMGMAGAIFGPAIAAMTLGILGSHGLAFRMGRNAACDHAGNVFIAVLAGAVGWWFSQRGFLSRSALLAAGGVCGAVDTCPSDRSRPGARARSQPVRDGRAALGVERADHLPTTLDLCSLRHALSFRERADAAAGRAKAGLGE